MLNELIMSNIVSRIVIYINIVVIADIKNSTSHQAVKTEEMTMTHDENLNHLTQLKLITRILILYSYWIWTINESKIEIKRQQEY